jgi:hypothetical protein
MLAMVILGPHVRLHVRLERIFGSRNLCCGHWLRVYKSWGRTMAFGSAYL